MGSASSFVMGYEGQPWLVTAWHVAHDRDTRERKSFEVLDQYGVKHSDSELEMLDPTCPVADVAVFRPWPGYFLPGSPFEPYGGTGVRPTRHAYFLGFPNLGEPMRYGLKYLSETTPFIKQGIVSGEARHRSGIAKRVWLLDALAHHGFSGGPVLIREPESENYRLLGIMSGYVPSNVRTLPGEVPETPGQIGGAPPLRGDPFAETNSGMAICFDIEHAVADIDDYLRRMSSK
jgi:hypothetical protein